MAALPRWNRAARYLTGELLISTSRATQQNRRENYGRLQARKVEVAAAGRGAAALEWRARLWLPSPDVAQQEPGPRHDRYVRAVDEEMDSRVVQPWKGREVDTTSATSKGRLLQSV
jgi:hypothetical protein